MNMVKKVFLWVIVFLVIVLVGIGLFIVSNKSKEGVYQENLTAISKVNLTEYNLTVVPSLRTKLGEGDIFWPGERLEIGANISGFVLDDNRANVNVTFNILDENGWVISEISNYESINEIGNDSYFSAYYLYTYNLLPGEYYLRIITEDFIGKQKIVSIGRFVIEFPSNLTLFGPEFVENNAVYENYVFDQGEQIEVFLKASGVENYILEERYGANITILISILDKNGNTLDSSKYSSEGYFYDEPIKFIDKRFFIDTSKYDVGFYEVAFLVVDNVNGISEYTKKRFRII